MTIFVRSLRAATLLLFAHALLAQQSQWVRPSANGRLVYSRDQNGVMIPDYSFAGYHSGGVALPSVPAQIKLFPSGADDTAAIQHAIDAISGRPLPSGLIEFQGKPVTPQSLYLSQLAERLGPDALKNIGYTTADPVH